MGQKRTEFQLNGTMVPALVTEGESKNTVVIILHGSDVSKETSQTDMQRLEEAGFWSVCIDAPHHGERSDGYMEIAGRCSPREQYLMMLHVVHQEASEVVELIKYYKLLGKKVALLGISMGAYAVFATLRLCKEADLYATFMGNPDFRFKDGITYSIPEITGPIDYPDEVFPANLFMVNALQDEFVDPNGARKFYNRLQTKYQNTPEKIRLLEYPHSSHIMRSEDWFDAWNKFIEKLKILS